nr:effector binding domain-containing protein [Holtiella tumoricola]
MPQSILQIWKQIYTSWIPREEYEIVDQPQLEVYFEVDEGYACEIWIPVK